MKIVITDLKDNTFYASIFLRQDGKVLEIDGRPSDAIALALRANASIFVSEKVFVLVEGSEGEKEVVTDALDSLNPEDFSKYKM